MSVFKGIIILFAGMLLVVLVGYMYDSPAARAVSDTEHPREREFVVDVQLPETATRDMTEIIIEQAQGFWFIWLLVTVLGLTANELSDVYDRYVRKIKIGDDE